MIENQGRQVTAEEMAAGARVDPKRFREALRKKCKWHERYSRWIVYVGSPEHDCMKRVLNELK